jgi:hypothetical protein
MKYRPNPEIIIEAFKWTGNAQQTEDPGWICDRIRLGIVSFYGGVMLIHTLEGTMTASQGDYVVLGTSGEVYPCKQEIFEHKYIEVS